MKRLLLVAAATMVFVHTFAATIDSLQYEISKTTGAPKARLELDLAEVLSSTDAEAALKQASTAENTAIRFQDRRTEVQAVQLQADIHLQQQAYSDARTLFNSAISLADKYGQLEDKSNAINGIGKIYLRTGKLTDAIEYFNRGLQMREKLQLWDLASNSHNNIGIVYREMGSLDSARIFFGLSYKLAVKTNNFKQQAEALNNMAGVYWKEGELNRAIELYEQSLVLREKTGDLQLVARSLNNIGSVYKDLSNYEKSLRYHLQALGIKREIESKSDIAYSLNSIGSVYLKLNRPDSAILYYQQALAIHQQLKMSAEMANSYDNLALAYQASKKYQEAIDHYSHAQKLREAIGNQAAISNTANLIGNLYLETMQFDKALEQYYLSLTIREQIDRRDLVGQSLNNIGLLFRNLKNYPKALQYFEQSLSIYTELKNNILCAYQHTIIGGTYWEMKDHAKALHHYGLSLGLQKNIGDKRNIANTFKNIGITYKDAGNHAKAIGSYREAISLFKSIRDSVGYAWTELYLGNVYKDAKRYPQAIDAYRLAERLFASTGHLAGTAAVKLTIAELNLVLNQQTEALASLDQAYHTAEKIADREMMLKSSQLLTETFARMGNYPVAYKYQIIHAAIKDSIAATETIKRLADLQISYEIEKKDAQIDRMQKENTIRALSNQRWLVILLSILGVLAVSLGATVLIYRHKAANSRKLERLNADLHKLNESLKRSEANLAHANMTKSKFFSIIAHDLKNPFSSFIGLTDMLIENYHVMSDEKKIKFLENLNTSASKTFFLLENLLDWSRSETTRIRFMPEDIAMKDIVEDVFELQKSTAAHQHIYLVTHIDDSVAIRGDRNMLKTVVRNLVSNAIKFTPENGMVTISATDEGEHYSIHIADTGRGISPESLPKLFDKQYDNRTIESGKEQKGSGLGLLLCKEFIDKHRSRIWVESELGKGSTFSFSVPKAGRPPIN